MPASCSRVVAWVEPEPRSSASRKRANQYKIHVDSYMFAHRSGRDLACCSGWSGGPGRHGYTEQSMSATHICGKDPSGLRRDVDEGKGAASHLLGGTPCSIHRSDGEVDPRRDVLVDPVRETRRVRAFAEAPCTIVQFVSPSLACKPLTARVKEPKGERRCMIYFGGKLRIGLERFKGRRGTDQRPLRTPDEQG